MEDTPSDEAVALAYQLALRAAERGMDYEEYTFELEDGAADGTQIKVLVIRV